MNFLFFYKRERKGKKLEGVGDLKYYNNKSKKKIKIKTIYIVYIYISNLTNIGRL